MKKGYYVHFGGGKTSGVAKKIAMQTAEFEKYFSMEEVLVRDVERSLPKRLIGLLPQMSIERAYGEALARIVEPDFLYIRRAVADKKYVSFLREIKRRYPACKIIVEVFTYPYDRDDFGKWNTWPFYFKELLYRGHLKESVDRFVTYSRDEAIFGVACIRTMNGVDIAAIRPVEKTQREPGVIHLLAVANFQRHHGYERILQGLHAYRGERTFRVHLVGEGPEYERYRRLSEKWKLSGQVIFYGKKTGEELERLYERADIALASFGMYKLGLDSISTLKTSEYLAKGLPIIAGCRERALEAGDPAYYRRFPNDKSPVDMARVADFYDELCRQNTGALTGRIRAFAERTVSMEAVLGPVVTYIKSSAKD